MRNCLLLISILLTLCICPCSAAIAADDTDAGSTLEYNVLMNARGNEVTAIIVIGTEPDGSMLGTMVNEFGVKILDFTYARGKAKVMNVFGPLNKWYIRKVLSKDFTFILSNLGSSQDVTDHKRRMILKDNGDIYVSNDRYKITYTLTKSATANETD